MHEPRTVELGTKFVPVQNGNKCKLTEKKYIFQSLLSKQEILDEVTCLWILLDFLHFQ